MSQLPTFRRAGFEEMGNQGTSQPAVMPLVLAGIVSAGAVLLTLGAGWGMLHVQRGLTPGDASAATTAVSRKPAGPQLNGADYAAGRDLYQASCIACHGPTGTGVANLGKDLVHGMFPLSLSDTGLAKLIIAGRAVTDPMNTTKIPMPPKGGREDFTDEQIRQIVVYVRGLQDPRRIPADVPAPAVAVGGAGATQGGGGGGLDPATIKEPTISGYEADWVLEGRTLYLGSCVSCHGADARGLKGLGKDLVASALIGKSDDDQMVAFLKKGRPSSDPENTTKVDMPPKGGNPALDDDKLSSIVVYIREVQARAKPGAEPATRTANSESATK